MSIAISAWLLAVGYFWDDIVRTAVEGYRFYASLARRLRRA